MSTVDNHSAATTFTRPSNHGSLCAICSCIRGGGAVQDAYFTTMLASRGLTAGAELTVLRNSGHGLLLIMVRDTCLALGRSEAAWIEVELIAAQEEPAEPAN
jgi:Fe2+ transport system protein FeoA